MKISTKGRYALRLMLDLALCPREEYIPLKQIAARQEISEKYLEQIITLLNRAGYVHSVRGSQGGYKLAMAPQDYTVGMILRLTEGSLSPVACLDLPAGQCTRSQQCATLELWKRLNDAISGVVDHTTLADLVELQKSKAGNDYVI